MGAGSLLGMTVVSDMVTVFGSETVEVTVLHQGMVMENIRMVLGSLIIHLYQRIPRMVNEKPRLEGVSM